MQQRPATGVGPNQTPLRRVTTRTRFIGGELRDPRAFLQTKFGHGTLRYGFGNEAFGGACRGADSCWLHDPDRCRPLRARCTSDVDGFAAKIDRDSPAVVDDHASRGHYHGLADVDRNAGCRSYLRCVA